MQLFFAKPSQSLIQSVLQGPEAFLFLPASKFTFTTHPNLSWAFTFYFGLDFFTHTYPLAGCGGSWPVVEGADDNVTTKRSLGGYHVHFARVLLSTIDTNKILSSKPEQRGQGQFRWERRSSDVISHGRLAKSVLLILKQRR